MAKVLIFADSHAQRGAWADYPIYDDALWALRQIAQLVIDEGVSVVIGCGDLLDKIVNRAGPPAMLADFDNRLGGVPFYFVQGQHERDDPPWLSLTRAEHIHGRTITLHDNRKVYGLDCLGPAALAESLAGIPADTDILVAHQMWAEWMGNIARPQGRLADVPNVSAVWTGDWHDHRLEAITAADGRALLVLSPGATCKQAIDEPDRHGVVIYDTTKPPGQLDAYRCIWLHSRPVVRVGPIMTEEEAEATVAGVVGLAADAVLAFAKEVEQTGLEPPAGLFEPLIRLEYSSAFADLPSRVEAAFARDEVTAHLFPKVIRGEQSAAVQASTAPTSLTEALPLVLDVAGEPEAHELAASLLAAGDEYESALNSWRKAYLDDRTTQCA